MGRSDTAMRKHSWSPGDLSSESPLNMDFTTVFYDNNNNLLD